MPTKDSVPFVATTMKTDDLPGSGPYSSVAVRQPSLLALPSSDVLGSLARWHRQADRSQPLTLLLCTLSAAQTLCYPKGTGKGDLLWETITGRLVEVVSPQGFAGDLGEGRLIGVTAGVANLWEATILAERIYTSLALPVVVEGSLIATQPCLGIALENPDSSLEGLVLRAQQALEQAIRCNTAHNQAIAIL